MAFIIHEDVFGENYKIYKVVEDRSKKGWCSNNCPMSYKNHGEMFCSVFSDHAEKRLFECYECEKPVLWLKKNKRIKTKEKLNNTRIRSSVFYDFIKIKNVGKVINIIIIGESGTQEEWSQEFFDLKELIENGVGEQY